MHSVHIHIKLVVATVKDTLQHRVQFTVVDSTSR